MTEKKEPIQVNFPVKLQGGVYSNAMNVSHTDNEFIMDFMVLKPPIGVVTSRIILSPRHMKGVLIALQENIAKYEERFGELKPNQEKMGEIKPITI